MRVLQSIHLYTGHIDKIDSQVGCDATFSERVQAMVSNGLNGPHILGPAAEQQSDLFLTSLADVTMQRAWAREQGMANDLSPHHILLAQIEHFKPDVLYTHGGLHYPDDVRAKLPGMVKGRMMWKAPPDFTPTIGGFQMALNNFPDSFPKYEAMGIATGYFSPSYDTAMEGLSDNQDRPIDVCFIGSYSRHHRRRAEMLEQVAKLSERHNVRMALAFDRAAKLANKPFGIIPPLSRYRAPAAVRKVAIAPQFGRAMYELFSQSKIVINTAIDVAGQDRGNIRCFEALGCGALMLSDSGRYPEGMVDGETMLTYDRMEDIPAMVENILNDEPRRQKIAAAGLELMRTRYSKAALWEQFKHNAARIG
jgi:hypothetical protein